MAGSSQRHYSTVAVVVVVLVTPWTATALPSADGILEHRPTQAVVAPRETFGNGFPPGFADNLPTKEFTGDFTRRVRRQAGITSDIDSILSGPYGGALDNDHLQALLLRNINIRPARQSPGHPRESRPPPRPSLSSSSSSSSTRFSSSPQGSFRPQQESRSPGPPSPGRPLPRPSLSSSASRFSSPPPGSFRPQQEPRSPDPPSADRPFPPSLFQAPRDPPPRFSPPRFTPSNPPLHSQPQERQEPFSSDSFTGQQFDSFSDIDSFFDSARLPRQRRDVASAAAPRDDAGSTQHIFVSPEEGSSPDSVTNLLNQERGVAGRVQAQLGQVRGRREHILGQTSSHPFAVPFVVPNAFELVGIRRRNGVSATAQERQGRQVGISDAIDNLLRSPYNGRMPSSLHSLFRSEDRRVIRNPPRHQGLRSQPFTTVGSDNPSQAVVRLFPNGRPPSPPRSHFAVTHQKRPHSFRRTRRDVGYGGEVNFHSDDSHFWAEHVKTRRERHLIPEEGSFPLPGKEFGEIIVHYDYGSEDPTHDSEQVVALHEEEVAVLLSPFADRPSELPSPRERKPRPHTSPRKVNPRPHPNLRDGKPRPHPGIGQGNPRSHPRPHPSRPAPARPPPRQRHRHPNHIPAFKPGPSPPAHILPPSSSIRAPRHVLWENQRLPRATRQLDIPLTRRMLLLDDSLDTVPESSSGFIVGKPADFPGFASIGGFGPMGDVDKTDVAGSFMQTINFPSVDFGPIDDSHPPFPQTPTFPQTPSFPEQVSELHDFPLDLLSISQKAIERSPPPDNNNSEYNNIFDNLYREDFEHFSNNDGSDKLSGDSFDNLNNNKDKDSINDNFDQQLTANPHTNKLTGTEGFRPIIPQHPPPPTLNPLTFSPSPPLPQHPALSRPPTLTPPSLPPPPPPAPSHVLFPNTVPNPTLSRPNPQPYRIQRIRTKRPNSGLASGIVSRLRDFVQPSASRPLRTLRQKTQDVKLDSDVEKTRRRRGVPDEDEEDPIEPQFASLIPHKRVHRVQTESHAPHSRKPREDTDMDTSPAELPHYFSSVSNFEFPRLQPRHRQSPAVSRSAHVTSQFSSHHSPTELRREDRHHPPHTQEPDYLQPDGQRFYPSFNGHISPSSRAPFFPSRPIPPHAPGPRGSRFLTRGVGFRERPNTTPRDPVGFRELHHQGPPVRETSSHIKPDAAFSASRRPFHREQEHFGHDNSILGSGNFEVLRGGTFYDLEDTNGHQHYDHLLHGDDFGFFPAVRPPSPPHTNYVDDFFSNFRDFSEFAKRRSDEGESAYVEDEYNPESYSRGYGSEHIHHFAPSNITLEVGNVTLANVTEPNTKSENANPSPVTKENTTTITGHIKQTHRRPNNIQEVLEEVDPHPSDYTASTTTVEEKDPMIAMF